MGTGWDGVETGLGTPNRRSGSASSAAGRAQSSREAHLSAPVTPPPAAFSETTGDFNVSYYIASDDPPAPMAAVNVTAFTRAAVFYVASWTGGPGSGAEGTVLGKARWLAEQLHKCARELGGGVGGGGAVEAATAGAHCTPRPPPPGPSGTAAASTAAPPGPCPTPLHPPCSTSTTRWPLWRRKAARRAATRWAAGQRLGRRRAVAASPSWAWREGVWEPVRWGGCRQPPTGGGAAAGRRRRRAEGGAGRARSGGGR